MGERTSFSSKTNFFCHLLKIRGLGNFYQKCSSKKSSIRNISKLDTVSLYISKQEIPSTVLLTFSKLGRLIKMFCTRFTIPKIKCFLLAFLPVFRKACQPGAKSYKTFFSLLLATRPNRLECLYLAITFQSNITFAGNTRSLPKKEASERSSNWVGSGLALKF